MHGDVVNLAARLMQAAPGTILCDTATYLAARDTMAFEELPPITVKGKTGQIAVYRPVGRHQAAPRRQTELVDRAPERAYMLAWLQNLQQNRSGAAVIQGEAGIGKTRLVADLLQKARAAGITVFTGSGGAIDRSTPYYAWRPVFRQLFKLDSQADDPADQRAWVLEKLQTMPPGQTGESTPANWLQLAPLLNPVLPLDWPENELTRHMTGKVRADNTQDLLLYLLQHTAALPAVIVLDDAHWLDSASWALAALTVQRVSPVLLLIVTRPIAHPVPTEYTQLRQAARTSYFHLNGLSNEDTVALVCRRLEVNSLPESLARLVQLKTEGNPFFGEELAYALRDNGIVHIENGECRLVNPNNHAETLHLPDTVQGVITSRIDRLAPGQQLTLKVASVIGRAFEYDTLHHIHPIEADKPHLTTHLSTLDRLEITQLENPPPDLAYIFKQLTTQEVAYNMLLFSQRRELHRAVAQWYEQTYPDALTPYYALLAYHWQVAESFDKAIVYMEKAGEQALHNYANEEAVEFFSQAIAVATEKETGVTHLQLAHWETKLGEAYINWAKLTDGRTHLEQGLALLGYPVPDNVAGKAMILTLQLGRQWLHRVWPHHFLGRQAARQDTLLPASRAYEGLTAVYYFANDTLLTLVAALRSLNLAEAAGPSPELARGSASVGVIVSFIPLHGLAQTYLQRALAMIRRFDDPPALAWVSLLGGVYYAGVGHWTEAQNLFEEGMALAERLGDHSRWHDAIGNLAMLHYFHSRFQQSAALFDDMLASTIRRRDAHNQAWALRGQVYCLILHGDFTEALHRLETLQTLLSQNPHIVDEALNIDLYGLLALVYLHLDRPEEAYQAVTQALTLMAKVSPTSFLSLPSYAAIAETCLLLWENNFAPAQGNGQPKAMARRALKGLRAYARVFPIGRPQARLWQGVFEWQAGRATRAEKLWAAAIESARTLHMSYLHAIACHQIARRLPFTDPMGEQYRRTAEKILAGLHLPPPADPAED
jgi:tetratricopeptide (TPR) repeat protein